MFKRLDNIKLNIGESETKLLDIAKKSLGGQVTTFKILKKSLDARDKNNIFWVYSIAFSNEEEEKPQEVQKIKNPPTVVVIGAGPSGLFCALRLIERGFNPIIVERGESVENRSGTVQNFFTQKILNENSNVQFGEGGAGTFSDGKLNTQTHDGFNKEVLELFHKFGANQEILYINKPHIGSDKLVDILKNIRTYIQNNGGKYLFNTKFIGLTATENKLQSVILQNTKTGEESEIKTNIAVCALGHSARDTFEMLNNYGLQMQSREFAIGVRIEHLAQEINKAQYGTKYKNLPTADYKLVSHAHSRTAFTFCMCPGGVVIPSASEKGGVVTNGMSLYAREGKNSNSALLVQMKQEDFKSCDLFAGMRFQQRIEQRAFEIGGRNYSAPTQLVKDFLEDKVSYKFGDILPTYSIGTKFAPLSEILPPITVESLKSAIVDMNKRLKGFSAPDAIMTGVETRFSSPIRILRDENCESVTIKGFYPCGEGSGYSGGITSSAADGLKTAQIIYEKYKS